MPFILASASPRRAELLKGLVPDFRVVASDSVELWHDQFTAMELARLNAVRKAQSVARKFPDALVLGADTIVCLGGKHFGKPVDLAEARHMLQQLQGATHQVVTGVCLIHWRTRRRRVFADLTHVRFKSLEPGQIDHYLASIDPLDKAGAYAIQENGELIAEEIGGSQSNVVGLPLERLSVELAAWGVPTPGPTSIPGQTASRL